jgi:hypothetical protein
MQFAMIKKPLSSVKDFFLHIPQMCFPSSYKNHMHVHEEPKFTCSYCQRRYHSKTGLLKHFKICNDEIKLECKSCKLIFQDKENFEMHVCHSNDPNNLTKTYESGKTEDGKHICARGFSDYFAV